MYPGDDRPPRPEVVVVLLGIPLLIPLAKGLPYPVLPLGLVYSTT